VTSSFPQTHPRWADPGRVPAFAGLATEDALKPGLQPHSTRTYPLLGEVVRHDHGRELVLRRRLHLAQGPFAGDHTVGGRTGRLASAEDLFAGEHPVGGRSASKVDPSQHGLPVMPMTFTLEMMAETASVLVPGKVVVAVRRVRLLRWLAFDDRDPSAVEVAARV